MCTHVLLESIGMKYLVIYKISMLPFIRRLHGSLEFVVYTQCRSTTYILPLKNTSWETSLIPKRKARCRLILHWPAVYPGENNCSGFSNSLCVSPYLPNGVVGGCISVLQSPHPSSFIWRKSCGSPNQGEDLQMYLQCMSTLPCR